MRKLATAALFFGLFQSHANAEPGTAAEVAARVIGQTTQETGIEVNGRPAAKSGAADSPRLAERIRFGVPDAAVGRAAE